LRDFQSARPHFRLAKEETMDAFVKDFLLAITVTAVAVLLSGMVQWFGH